MRRFFLRGLILTISAASLQLSGCTSRSLPSQIPLFRSSPPALVDLDPLSYQLLATDDSAVNDSQALSDAQSAMHKKLFVAMELTQAQKDEFKAIKAKHLTEMKKLGGQAERDKLKGLLLASSIDQTALRDELKAMEALCRAKIPHIVAMASEMRAVLAPTQRTKALEVLKEVQTKRFDDMHDKLMTKLTAKLNLTPSQIQDLTALKNMSRPVKAEQHRIMVSAVTRFLEDGNKEAFAESLNSLIGMGPQEEGIKWLATLDESQRQLLVTTLEKQWQKMKAEHEKDLSE